MAAVGLKFQRSIIGRIIGRARRGECGKKSMLMRLTAIGRDAYIQLYASRPRCFAQ